MGSKVVNFVALSLTAAALGAAAAYFTGSSNGELSLHSAPANAKRPEDHPATSTPISAMPVTAMPVTAMPPTGMPVSGLGSGVEECDVQCGAEASKPAENLGTSSSISSSGTPKARSSMSDTEFSATRLTTSEPAPGTPPDGNLESTH